MKYFFILALLLASIFANPYENIVNYKLENGLNVYLLPNKKSKNVQIELDVNVGMKAEDKRNAGISHLLEHLIFRDQRVKYKDYYDLIQDRGATYVNGYTSNYTTSYVTTIDSKNAYWITKTFYKMLFDKNITNEDLEVERKALQLEIGEPNWTDYLSFNFFKKFGEFINKVTPRNDYNLYKDDFKIDTKKDKEDYKRFDKLVYKTNNKKFTLNDILKHYKEYYYPANMTLKIVGNFDLNKMKETINTTFANAPKRDGKTILEPIYKDATLSHKPFIKKEMPGVLPKPRIALGYKYIDKDMREYMIIDSYFSYLADRLNRMLRNKEGDTYSIYGTSYTKHNAGLGYIDFYTHHNKFEHNLKTVKDLLTKESSGNISDEVVKKALENSKKYYTQTSNSTSNLMDIIDNVIFQKRYYKENYQNPYTIVNTITPKEFKDTIKKRFTKDNFYMFTQKDYFLFPYEAIIVLILSITLFILFSKKYLYKLKKEDILFKRNLTNIFIMFLVFALSIIAAVIISEWVKYAIIKLLNVDILKVQYFGTPLDYLYTILDFLLFMAIYILLFRYLFSWLYTKLFVTKDSIILAGGKAKIINLNDIDSLEVVPWSIDKIKDIYGLALLFFRKLLKITTKDGKVFYIRAKDANRLKDELESVILHKISTT